MEPIIKTPLVACLKYKGYVFAWFYDSYLAIVVANNLASSGLFQDISVYKDFNLDDLHHIANWHYLQVRCHGLFISYHRTFKVGEVHEIGSIINKSLLDYEKGNYRNDTN